MCAILFPGTIVAVVVTDGGNVLVTVFKVKWVCPLQYVMKQSAASHRGTCSMIALASDIKTLYNNHLLLMKL